jgi:hypothetical protein
MLVLLLNAMGLDLSFNFHGKEGFGDVYSILIPLLFH